MSTSISGHPSILMSAPHTVDLLNERLDLALLGLLVLRHAAGDLGWVALDAGDEGVGKWVRLGAVVEGRNDHALLAGIATPGDNDNASDLEAVGSLLAAVALHVVGSRRVQQVQYREMSWRAGHLAIAHILSQHDRKRHSGRTHNFIVAVRVSLAGWWS